jgi:hypothetical protein
MDDDDLFLFLIQTPTYCSPHNTLWLKLASSV